MQSASCRGTFVYILPSFARSDLGVSFFAFRPQTSIFLQAPARFGTLGGRSHAQHCKPLVMAAGQVSGFARFVKNLLEMKYASSFSRSIYLNELNFNRESAVRHREQ